MLETPGSVVLGIDPSLTNFAVTAMSMEKPEEYKQWKFRSIGSGVGRLLDIRDSLRGVINGLWHNGHQTVSVVIEDAVVMSHSAVKLGELHGVIKAYLADEMMSREARYPLRVPPTMLKKYATDRGNAKKNEILLACYKKWGQEFTDDNMADSYVLARIGCGLYGTAYERSTLEKLADQKFRDV